MRRLGRLACLALLVGSACRRSEPAEGIPAIPESLRIEVEIDGRPAPALDAARLKGARPDHAQGERRAWRLSSLLGPAYARPNAVLEVEARDGAKTVVPRPAQTVEGRELVLVLNRRGEVRVALMRPDDPFPDFHGRGGNRGREGDPAPRIHDVARIRLYVEAERAERDDARPRAGAGALALAVVVDGGSPIIWTAVDLARLPAITVEGEGGEGQREAWPLRALATTLVGPKARVERLTGEGGRSVAVEPKDWADLSKVPILRVNRRGQIKFQWSSPAGVLRVGDDLRDVSWIAIRTGE